jgi:hypothetical protein
MYLDYLISEQKQDFHWVGIVDINPVSYRLCLWKGWWGTLFIHALEILIFWLAVFGLNEVWKATYEKIKCCITHKI